jgi:hypothetical protein
MFSSENAGDLRNAPIGEYSDDLWIPLYHG